MQNNCVQLFLKQDSEYDEKPDYIDNLSRNFTRDKIVKSQFLLRLFTLKYDNAPVCLAFYTFRHCIIYNFINFVFTDRVNLEPNALREATFNNARFLCVIVNNALAEFVVAR